ncbi:hypothetical protein BBP00_00003963 [Phytophthora kernoviae]|uniref:Protein kinase domain-containing protein n=1 Tax=Phytophthora kernoviae TaxID=325452 RepID=A0A3F2RTU2_9STRA|nr:hypothetical protein BBP00_00003963 [Phytophthora kernoviae]
MSSCTRTETALTSDCNLLCPEGRPCVAYAAGDEAECSFAPSTFGNCAADDLCTYECFATGPEDFAANGAVDFSIYTFLIPFGDDVGLSEQEMSWTSKQETAANAELAAAGNLTDEYPSKSNDALQHIEPLDFMAATTRVVLAGGSSVFGVRGKVVRVQLPQKVFTADQQLQSVTLANFGLEQILNSSFPSELVNLTISNCLMTSYPIDLQTMDVLENLDLSKNYFSYFPADLRLPQLQTLNMSSNDLAGFECSLSSLVTLDLANNNFTSIPAAIFELSSLQWLDLRGNNFTDIELTTSQFNFLQALKILNVDTFGNLNCTTSAQLQTINGNSTLSVCISDTGSADGETTTDKALITGITAAVIVLTMILIIIGVFRCLRRRAQQMKPEPEIINLRYEVSYPIDLRASRRISESGVGSLHSAHDFPYGSQLEALRVNPDDLEYIRRLSSEHRSRRARYKHRVTFLMRHRGSRFLVCKRLQEEVVDEVVDARHFAEEVQLAATLSHHRVVVLVGVVYSRIYGLEALYEYMEGGDLRSYLVDLEDSNELRSWRSPMNWKLQVAFDLAEALAYAHSFSPGLVHRDLTSHSVLLSSPPEVHAQLDDFVVSQRSFTDMSTIGLTLREEMWLPPEIITGTADYSAAGDIYALGVILSEIDTHSLPYENVHSVMRGSQRMSEVAILDQVASGKLQPAFTLGCPTGVRELGEKCLSFEASDRPTALQCVIVLHAMIADGRRSSNDLQFRV